MTGTFSGRSLQTMLALLAEESGGAEALRQKPRAVFDVCPSPPLNWSEFASQNMVDLARAGVPAEIVSMPLAGATAPVALAGSIVQHAAECISGIVIQQLAQPGAPVVWGGAPAIFDMRSGTTPMGAIETAMLDLACAQVGKLLGLTHTRLSGCDGREISRCTGRNGEQHFGSAGRAGRHQQKNSPQRTQRNQGSAIKRSKLLISNRKSSIAFLPV